MCLPQDLSDLLKFAQGIVDSRASFWSRKETWQQQFEEVCILDVLTKSTVDIKRLCICMDALMEEIAVIEVTIHA